MREENWNGWIDGWMDARKEGRVDRESTECWDRERKEREGSRTERRNET